MASSCSVGISERMRVKYQQITGANLIVVIDQITPTNMTVLEELLFDCDPQKDLHLLLSSPGDDGERRCA